MKLTQIMNKQLLNRPLNTKPWGDLEYGIHTDYLDTVNK